MTAGQAFAVQLQEGNEQAPVGNIFPPAKLSLKKGADPAAVHDGKLHKGYRQGEILVKFRATASEQKKERLHKKHGGKKIKEYGAIRLQRVKLKAGDSVSEAIKRYKADADVEYAEANLIVHAAVTTPDDTYYGSAGSWGQSFNDMWGLQSIQAGTAWDITRGDSSVVVAVSDTGVDFSHADLQGKSWVNGAEIPGNGIDDDGNGYIDDVSGWDFVHDAGTPADDHGHGTHVSGTIAAVTNNGQGIAGISWQSRIMALKFLDAQGSGDIADGLASILYAADNGARVVNCSWGGNGYSQALEDAINYAFGKGVVVVAAAGNDYGSDAKYFHPAGAENVLTVAAVDHQDVRAGFSNIGQAVEVSAPGVDILSLRAANTDMYGDGSHVVATDYYRASGTSMAAPHVSGLAALLVAKYPSWSPGQVMSRIVATTDAINDDQIGTGRINADKALTQQPTAVHLNYLRHYLNDSAGNGNGILDAGETATLTVVFRNNGAPVTGVTAILSSADPFVTITNGTAALGSLAGWTRGEANYTISVSSEAAKLHAIPFTLTLKADGVADRIIPINERVTPYLPGWPVDIQQYAGSHAIMADVDQDGRLDVVIAAKDLFVIKGDGSVMAGWPKTGDETVYYALPAVGDLNGDGEQEVVAFSNEKVIAFNKGGELMPGFPASSLPSTFQQLLADLDGDGYKEIISLGDGVNVIRHDGLQQPGWPVSFPAGSYACGLWGNITFAVGDLDGDGKLEVVAPISCLNKVYAWHQDGSLVDGWPISVNSPFSISIADVDLDGKAEVFVGRNDWMLSAFHGDGTPLPGWPQPGNACAIGDVTGDGIPEIVTHPYAVYVYRVDGSLLSVGSTRSNAWAAPSLADVDGDGIADVVARDYANCVYAWHGDGTPIPEFPVCLAETGDAWSNSVPALGDINGDGLIDLVTGPAYDSNIYAFNLPGAYTPETSHWPMNRHDASHTSQLHSSFAIITPAIPPAAVNTPYHQTLKAVAGFASPYLWSVTDGILPEGLSLDPLTGVLSGAPSLCGTWTFTVQVQNATLRTATRQFTLSVAEMVIADLSLTPGRYGEAYRKALTVAGGSASHNWALMSGALPMGISLGSDGLLSGVPLSHGLFTFTVQVTSGALVTEKSFSWSVLDNPLRVLTTSLPKLVAGAPYSATLRATGGIPPYSWSLDISMLPGGLNLSPATGVVSGSLTGEGTYYLVVTLMDSQSSTVTAIPLTVIASTLAVSSTSLPTVPLNAPYTANFTAIGGSPPYSWSLEGGELPQGLTLSKAGVISGTASQPGSQEIVVGVTDSTPARIVRSFTLTVGQAPVTGNVWTWGQNWAGQLGDGSTTDKDMPVEVVGLGATQSIAGAMEFSLALKPDGTVWTWGDNFDGGLGDGSTGGSRTLPGQVPGLTSVKAIAAGWFHALALKEDGTLWTWGSYSHALPDPALVGLDSATPVEVTGVDNIRSFVGGDGHSLVLKNDGTVWAWGRNDHGQLGDGTNEIRTAPVQVIGLTDVVAVAAGVDHSLALTANGTVWTWGRNTDGQLGDGTNESSATPVQVQGLSGVTAIFGGGWHSLALQSDGAVRAWGANWAGQLGDGSNTASNLPVTTIISGVSAIDGECTSSLALKADGTVWEWGFYYANGAQRGGATPVQVAGLYGVTAIAAGMDSRMALKPPTVWRVHSSGPPADNPYGMPANAGVDWRLSEHGAIATGDYLKIADTYYYAYEPPVFPGSWSGPDYTGAGLQQINQVTCQRLFDQGTGQPVMADTSGMPGMLIESGSCQPVLDITPPVTFITAPVNGETITGTNFTITGSSSDGSGWGVQNVEVSTDGGTNWNMASGTGNWVYGWALPQNGQFIIISRATDNAGNMEVPAGGITVTVANVLTTAVVAPANGSFLTGTAFTVTGTAASSAAVSLVEVSIDGGSTWRPADGTTSWSCSCSVPGDGQYSIVSRVTDVLGNVSYSTPATVTLDGIPPVTVAQVSGTLGQNGWYISDATVILAASDSLAGVLSTEYKIGAEGAWVTYSGPIALTHGMNTLFFRSRDRGGNIEQTDNQLEIKVDRQGTTSWGSDGPYGGVISALAVSSSYDTDKTIFAAGQYMGVYRSNDGGATWALAANGLGANRIYSLAISPDFASDQKIFAGAYEGIYRSADGGVSWALMNSGVPVGYPVSSLAISPDFSHDGIVFAAAGSAGAFRSVDGGMSWSAIDFGGLSLNVTKVVVSPNFATDRAVYMADFNGSGGVVRSTDGGVTWFASSKVATTNNQLQALAVAGNNVIFAANLTGTYRSIDGGVSWSFAVQQSRNIAVSPNFASDGTVIAGSYRSTDGGLTWGAIPNNAGYVAAFSPAFAADGTVFSGTSQGVFRSTDRGVTWSGANKGMRAFNIVSVVPSPGFTSDQTLFAAASSGGLFRSVDGGLSWLPIGGSISNQYIVSLVASPDYINDHALFVLLKTGALYKSSDGGQTWSYMVNVAPGETSIALALSPNFAADQTMFVGSEKSGSGQLRRSTNGGTSWQTLSWHPSSLSAIAFSPAYAADHAVIIAKGTYVSQSTDNGTNWTTVPIGQTTNSLAVSPAFTTDRTVYVGTSAGVYRSTDGGQNWVAVNNGLPTQTNGSTIPVYAVTLSQDFLSDRIVFAGTDNGVFRSADGGATWNDYNSGSTVKVRILALSPAFPADKTLFVGAYYGSVWSRTLAPFPASAITAPIDGAAQKSRDLNISGTATDGTGSGIDHVEVSIDGGITWNRAAGTTAWTLALTVPADGSYVLRSRGHDMAGNIGAPSTPVAVTVDTVPPATTASPAGGIYPTAQSVTLAASEAGTIFYTLDGSDPVTSQTRQVYAAALTVSASATLMFYAQDVRGNIESVKTEAYLIGDIPRIVDHQPADGAIAPEFTNVKASFDIAMDTATVTTENFTLSTFSGGAKAFSAGRSHSLAVMNDGKVVAWGRENLGDTLVPPDLSDVTAVAAGEEHSVALKQDGTVVAWGDNRANQCTVPAGLTGVTAIAAGTAHTLALKSDGTVAAWGADPYYNVGQASVPADLSGVAAIAAGYIHSVALKSDGTVVGWGWNDYGQTTPPNGLSGVSAIAAGYGHTVALKNDGTVVAWGSNIDGYGRSSGQATVPEGLSGVTAIAAGAWHTLALKSDGTVVAWGSNLDDYSRTSGQATVPEGLSGVVAIAAGEYRSLALKNDGRVVVWGNDTYVPAGLRLSDGLVAGAVTYGFDTRTATFQPMSQLENNVVYHAMVTGMKSEAGIPLAAPVTWSFTALDATPPFTTVSPGGGAFGAPQMVTLSANEPATVRYTTDGSDPTAYSPVYSGPVAITTSKVLKFFASDTAGNSEAVRTEVYTIGNPPVATALPTSGTYGTQQTVTLTANQPATIYYTNDGSDPTGSATAQPYSGPLTISASTNIRFFATNVSGDSSIPKSETYLIADPASGNVWAWGENFAGQLGDGTNEYRPVPVLSLVSDVAAVASAMESSMALDNSGRVWRWGGNYGYTPAPVMENVSSIAAGWFHALALDKQGRVWRWGNYNQWGDHQDLSVLTSTDPVLVTGLDQVTAAIGGLSHSLALRSNGTVWSWGANGHGQLGNGTTANSITPVMVEGLAGVTAIAAGFDHSFALLGDGTVWAWGSNAHGELGNGTKTDSPLPVQVAGLSDVVAIFGGGSHSLALKSDGTVLAWGLNDRGQLGDGTFTDRTTPVQVSGLNGVKQLGAKCFTSMALKTDGTVWNWGMMNGSVIPKQVQGLAGITAIASGMFNGVALRGAGESSVSPQWAMYQHDPQHTGKSPATGPSAVNVKWSLQHPNVGPYSSFVAGTAVGADGTIYAGGTDGKAYALRPDGTVKYTYDNIGLCCSPPVIGADGTIYFSGNQLYALNPDFTLKWIYADGGACCGSMIVGPDGTIYVANGALHAVNPVNGIPRWVLWAPDNTAILAAPALSVDGSTVYLSTEKTLYGLNPADAGVRWQMPVDNIGLTAPVVGTGGTIYIPSASALLGVNPDGTLLRQIPIPAGKQVSAMAFDAANQGGTLAATVYPYTVDPDTEVTAWGTNGELYAIDPNAPNPADAVRWTRPIQGSYDEGAGAPDCKPIIDSRGAIYVGAVVYSAPMTESGVHLYAFSANGNQLFDYYTPTTHSSDLRLPVIDNNGVLYLLVDGAVKAFSPEAPAQATWTAYSSGPPVPNPYNLPPNSAIDWPAYQHDSLIAGDYLQIAGTYYLIAGSVRTSWNGGDYNSAALQQCDQATKQPFFDGNGQPLFADLSAAAGADISLYSFGMPPGAFPLTITASGTGTGYITELATGFTTLSQSSHLFPSGMTVTLAASSDAGSIFAGWSGCVTVNGNECSVTMTTARNVTATFNSTSYPLSVTISGSGAVHSSPLPDIGCFGGTCSQSYAIGTAVQLIPVPAAGWITGWTGCDSVAGNVCTVTMSGARSVTATFAPMSEGFAKAADMIEIRAWHQATILSDGKVLVTGGSSTNGILFSAEMYNPATNTWSSAANLAAARSGHTATRLSDGKVLVAGGNAGTALDSAELYDPATNFWSPAGNLAEARTSHTATLLPNGKVLVVGGNAGVSLHSAELYDPATNSWTSAGVLAEARNDHTTTLLPNGKVLVAGGRSTANYPDTFAEIYDPATNSWSSLGRVDADRWGHTATLLDNGKVLLAGGIVNGVPAATAELYDSVTNTWTSTGDLPEVRRSHTATLLNDGRVLVAGGYTNGPLETTDIYDPATSSWYFAGKMSNGRWGHTATRLNTGRVFLVGGFGLHSSYSAELYTPANLYPLAVTVNGSGEVHSDPAPDVACFGGTCTNTYGGGATVQLTATPATSAAFIAWSGCDSFEGNVCAVTLNAAKNVTATFTLVPTHNLSVNINGSGEVHSSPTPDISCSAGTCSQSYESGTSVQLTATPAAGFSFSGWTGCGQVNGNQCTVTISGDTAIQATFIADVPIMQWLAKAQMPVPVARAVSGAVDGTIYVIGGNKNDGSATATVQAYNTGTGSWQVLATPFSVGLVGAASVTDGNAIYVAGGDAGIGAYSNGIFRYDTLTGTSVRIGSLVTPRFRMNAAVLNGKMYVVGGIGQTGVLNTIEEVDLATGISTVKGVLPEARTIAGVNAVNGRLYIFGGSNNGLSSAVTWEYDPAASQFTTRSPMPVAGEVRPSVQADGLIYVVGGMNQGQLGSAVQVYDPALDRWTQLATLPTVRFASVAEVVDGTLYVMGGFNWEQPAVATNEAFKIGNPWVVYHVGPPDASPSEPKFVIDWDAASHALINSGNYLRIGSTRYYVMGSNSGSWDGPAYDAAGLQQCDQLTGAPLFDAGGQPLLPDLRGKEGTPLELFGPWPAPSWTVFSSGPPVPNPWNLPAHSAIDWQLALHGTLAMGNYLKIAGTYYYVLVDPNNPPATGSWSGASFAAAVLQQCDQTTGIPLFDGNGNPILADTSSMPGQGIAFYNSWPLTPVDTTPPVTTAIVDCTRGSDGWCTSNATVTLSATDNQSGVLVTQYKIGDQGSWIDFAGPFTISTQGSTTVYYHSMDKAGILEADKSVEVKIEIPFWEGIGPYGGNVRSIAFSPSFATDGTVFSSGNYSGIYRSTDGGSSWAAVTSELSGKFVNAIAVSPRYDWDHTLFAGTNDGVYRSADAGTSWSLLTTGIPSGCSITALAVSPDFDHDGIMFAAADTCGLYRSTDGGNSWSAVNFGGQYYSIRSVAISPNFAIDRTAYAGDYNGNAGVLRSTDGGVTWTACTRLASVNNQILNVAVTDNGIVFATIAAGGTYRSADGGQTWTLAVANPGTPLAVSPRFSSDGTVFAGNYRSTDGGLNWTHVVTDYYVLAIAVSPAFGTDGTVLTGKDIYGIQRSTDGGTTWASSTTGILGLNIVALATSPAFSSDGTIFAAGNSGGVYRTTDGGTSWQSSSQGMNWSDLGLVSLSVSPDYANDRTVFAASTYRQYRSTDGGASWTPSNVTAYDIKAVAPSPNYAVDRTVLMVTQDFLHGDIYIYRSTDGGTTWQQGGNSIFGSSFSTPCALVFSPSFAVDGIVMFTAGNSIYISSNGGVNWSRKYPGANMYGIAFSPGFRTDRTIYAGTSKGVYISTDGGNTWSAKGSGLPLQTNGYPVTVYALRLTSSFAADHTMFAGTDSGVFRSTDGGNTWNGINVGLAGVKVRALALSPTYATDNRIFAGAYYGSVWGSKPVVFTAPIASFTGSPLSGQAPLLVTLADTSINTPTSWAWQFGDGSTNATIRNPLHAFSKPGIYTVKLTVSNPAGTDTREIFDYVTVQACPNQPVRVGTGSQLSFDTVQAAYDTAVAGDTISAQAVELSGDIRVTRDITVVLRGGYDCGYTQNPVAATVTGALRVSAGTVKVENLNFQ